MVALISVGISNYTNTKLNIPCACKDAEKVYFTLQNILGSTFNQHSSVCLRDLSCNQFTSIIQAEILSLTKDDTLVLYFSGHANIDGNVFRLLFKDYDRLSTEGSLDLGRISTIFQKAVFDVVLILDCCQSGGATSLANAVKTTKQLSVIASCGELDKSEYSDQESHFTKILCKAIKQLDIKGKAISLVSISKEINSLGYKKSVTNVGASSNADFILSDSNRSLRNYDDFPKRFLNQLKISNSLLRESLWYSIADTSRSSAEAIFKDYFQCLNPDTSFYPEAGWLVRRAIGSAIAHFDDLDTVRKSLINSFFWQEQCIGIIGSRYLFKTDDKLYEFITDLILRRIIHKSDPLWLANLYMAESPKYDYTLFLDTKLGDSNWGIVEIFKTINKKIVTIDEFKSTIRQINKKDEICSHLDVYLAFYQNDSHENKLFSILLGQKGRGRLPTKVKSKFLLSALYGAWRGHIDLDLRGYIETTSPEQIYSELSAAASLPDIDHKIAIYDFFRVNINSMKEFKDALEWGLIDEHPRVRTSAVKAFKAIDHPGDILFNKSIQYDFINDALPGLFDLFLECPYECTDRLDKFFKDTCILNGDIKSFESSWDLVK